MSLRMTQEEFDAIQGGVEAKRPRPVSVKDNKYKAQVELIFQALGVDIVREYRFHETRKWRWDWALPAIKVCFEYQGLNFGHGGASGHQTIKGIVGENHKYSEGSIAGWCIILVNAVSVESGLAHDLIRRAIDSRRINHTAIPGVKIRVGNTCDL